MKTSAEIKLDLQSVEDIFFKNTGPLNCRRLLNETTEEFIIEESAKYPRHMPFYFTVYVPPHEIKRVHEVVSAIHKHFAYRREKSKEKVKNTLHVGWRSLVIGFIFLVLTYLIVQMLSPYFFEGGLAITIREFLIITAWVALWRPAELLLYGWYPFLHEANLFHRLEQSDIKVIDKSAA